MLEMTKDGIVPLQSGKDEKNDILNKTQKKNILHEDVYRVSKTEPGIFVKCLPAEYIVFEPSMSEREERIYNHIICMMRLSEEKQIFKEIKQAKSDTKNAVRCIGRIMDKILDLYSIKTTNDENIKINYFIRRNMIGLERIQPLLNDPHIEDISCNGYDIPVFIHHRKHGSLKTNIRFEKNDLDAFVRRMAQISGKMVTLSNPMTNATLPDGSRAQITLGEEITTKGSTFTIRKFREKPYLPIDLVRSETFAPEMMAYLRLAVEFGMNVMFAGGTASGKTTAVNAVCSFIPIHKKIVSIEDTRELNLFHENWIPGVSENSGISEASDSYNMSSGCEKNIMASSNITLYDLLKAAMRQRPEYIIVGEIRGREAYVLFQAMATGHATLSTIHAESIENLVHRLENPPLSVPRSMIQTLDILAVLEHIHENGKNKRRCTSIHEIIKTDPKTKEIITNEMFRILPENKLMTSQKSYVLNKIKSKNGWSDEKMKHVFSNYIKGFL